MGDCWKNWFIRLFWADLSGLFWADFEPKIEWVLNVFWGGSKEVKCSLPRGKSHGADGSSRPFMSEWEHDVVFEFVELNIYVLNVGFLERLVPH